MRKLSLPLLLTAVVLGGLTYLNWPVTAAPCAARDCLPVTYRIFLPLVLGGSDDYGSGPPQPPQPACAAEVEPNALHGQAQSITAACLVGNQATDMDEDWYRLEICQPVTLRLDLAAEQRITLNLHGDPPGAPLWSGGGGGVTATVTLPNVAVGTYYVEIPNYGGVAGNPYTLTVQAWSNR